MTESNFTPPEVDALNELMPAFHFVSRIATDESKAVYLVKQKSLDRKAAIKLYSPELSRSPQFREAFAATTKVMAKLKHPNLIGVYDSGIEQDMLYLVTEFVAGKPLWNSTRGEPVHVKHVQTLVEGICVGMAHAHKNQICHGSLSLKNVLLDESRMPKIGGFSQATGDTSKLDPSALRFRAPELAEQGAKPTPQCDIYSIGVILREMAVGQTEGAEALAKIEKIGPAIKTLVEKATSVDPSKRHRSVEAFYEELLDAFDENAPKKVTSANKLLPAGGAGGSGGVKSGAPKPGAPAGRMGKPGAAPAVVMPMKASSPMKIWVHIVIIIVLLVAIKVAWGAYKEKKERNSNPENIVVPSPDYRVVPANRPSNPNYSRPSVTDRTNPDDDFPDDSDSRPVVEAPRKDAAKELARLKSDLVKGSRSQMPEGSIQLDNQYYYYVNIPMTWPDAFWFSQEHGGHLAIPGSKATAEWMRENLAKGSDAGFWVGAAKSGRYAWTLADGRPWRPQDPSLSLGEYISVGSQGQLEPQEGQVEKEFVIQWSKNGTNPGSLESLLEITKQSLATTAPIFPPGTRNFGVRNYLYVPKTTDWKQAVLSARAGGGHLIAVGGIAEKFNVEKMTEQVKVGDGVWLGGFYLEGKGWRWSTGEAWHSSEWPQTKPAETADASLLMGPGGRWEQRSRDAKASGYIIEWSEDHKNAAKQP